MNTSNNSISNFFKRFTSSKVEDNEFRQCVIKYSFSTVVFLIVCIIIYGIVTNKGSANYNLEKYFFVYMFPLLMIFAIMLNLGSSKNNRRPFLEIFGILVVVIIAVYYYSLSNGTLVDTASMTHTLLLIAISLVGLAVLYNILINYLNDLKGWPGFFAQLIFYLPCVLYEAWEGLLKQLQLTSISMYLLLVIEIILIIVYAYLPSLTDHVSGINSSKLLQKNIVPLNKGKHTIATSSMLKKDPSQEQIKMGIDQPFFPRNYCISFWVFVNPQSPENYAYSRECELLNYGYMGTDQLNYVKPLVTYYGGGNKSDQPAERNKFVFYFVNYKNLVLEESIESHLPKIGNEIKTSTKKIQDLTYEINNPSIEGKVKKEYEGKIKELKSYSKKLQNTSMLAEVNKEINTLNTIIKAGKLSNSQIQDLKKSRDQQTKKKDFLLLSETFELSELEFLKSQDYEKMKETFYQIDVPNQKWNNITLNYNDNSVDVYMNGKLERTFYLAGKDIPSKNFESKDSQQTFLPKYNDLDTITIGDVHGIDGGICNVVYFPEPLTAEQIIFNYNTTVLNDPPIPRQKEDKTLNKD